MDHNHPTPGSTALPAIRDARERRALSALRKLPRPTAAERFRPMEAGARDRFRALLGEVMSDIARSHSVTPLPARTLARRRKA